MEFNWIIGLLYLIPIFLVVYFFLRSRKNWDPVLKKQFIVGLSTKLVGSILFVLVYRYHFQGGDTFMYFRNIQSLNAVFFESPLSYLELVLKSQVYNPEDYIGQGFNKYWDVSGVWAVIRIGSFLSFLGLNNFLGTSLLFACFSFLGLWFLFLALKEKYPGAQKFIFIALFMVPSFIFWTSGLMKESLLFGALGFFLYVVLKKERNEKAKQIPIFVLFLLSLYILVHIKQYIFYVVFLGFVLYVFLQWLRNKNLIPLKQLFPIMLIAFVCSFLLIQHRFVPVDWLSYAEDFYVYNMERSQQGEDLINNTGSDDFSLISVIIRAPKAFVSGIIQPYFWNCRNYLEYLASAEGIIIFISLLAGLRYGIMHFRIRQSEFNWDGFQLFCVFCGLLLLVGISLVTPNIGSLVRYRTVAFLFFIIPCAIAWSKKTKEI